MLDARFGWRRDLAFGVFVFGRGIPFLSAAQLQLFEIRRGSRFRICFISVGLLWSLCAHLCVYVCGMYVCIYACM